MSELTSTKKEFQFNFANAQISDLQQLVIQTSDEQVAAQGLMDVDDRLEFQLGCDALNLWRVRWRYAEDFDEPRALQIQNELSSAICAERNYPREEFDLAVGATKDRARYPFGYDPLQYAFAAARKNPIVLLADELRTAT